MRRAWSWVGTALAAFTWALQPGQPGLAWSLLTLHLALALAHGLLDRFPRSLAALLGTGVAVLLLWPPLTRMAVPVGGLPVDPPLGAAVVAVVGLAWGWRLDRNLAAS